MYMHEKQEKLFLSLKKHFFLFLIASCSGQFSYAENKFNKLVFSEIKPGEYSFNTGVLEGKLRHEGRSIGLLPVTHIASQQQIASGEGLFNHYRVFTKGKRYGYGARRWPSSARLNKDGSIEVTWPANEERPFKLSAHYRWVAADTLDLVTTVEAKEDLAAFEVFLASYLEKSFVESLVHAPTQAKGSAFVSADKQQGDWQMFPRDKAALKVINDGRWNLEPHPLQWTQQANYGLPIAVRQAPSSKLSVISLAKTYDCFGIFTPYNTEKHYSQYLSLFGQDIAKGQSFKAHGRLVIKMNPSEEEILAEAKRYLSAK